MNDAARKLSGRTSDDLKAIIGYSMTQTQCRSVLELIPCNLEEV